MRAVIRLSSLISLRIQRSDLLHPPRLQPERRWPADAGAAIADEASRRYELTTPL